MNQWIFGAKGISLMKLYHLNGGVNACTKFGGTAPLKFWKAKNV